MAEDKELADLVLPKTTLTVEDLNKAATFYEGLIDEIVKNPTKETVGLLTDAMEALDGLSVIYEDLLGANEYSEDDK